MATITAADGTIYDAANLRQDEDGYWVQMGGAMALVIPSAAFEQRRAAEAQVAANQAAKAQAAAVEEAAIQAEIRALAKASIAARQVGR